MITKDLKESDIKQWKENVVVKECYKKLYKKIISSEPETYMSRIIQRLRKGKKPLPNLQIAYAISVCEILLNPRNLHIQVTEAVIKPLLTKNLVSI
jgi:hypothetical protein